ncbi:hypothetical protein AAIB33_07340 [Microbacterium sp. AZCO]|uniref:hypothetical protein n=1 Tax=Microbacterium sp. AZCO TaxID=3142976 RepID=UPI0031F3DBFC
MRRIVLGLPVVTERLTTLTGERVLLCVDAARDNFDRMTLRLKRVPAEVKHLTEREERWYVQRADRGRGAVVVTLPQMRGAWDVQKIHLLSGSAVRASATEPRLLDTSQRLGRTFWLIGDEVVSVDDVTVTSADVAALRAKQEKRRAEQLRRARAELVESAD